MTAALTEIRTAPFGAPQPTPQTTTTTVTPAPAAATFSLPGGTGTTASEVRVIADKDTNSTSRIPAAWWMTSAANISVAMATAIPTEALNW